jgi:hypothetical protein
VRIGRIFQRLSDRLSHSPFNSNRALRSSIDARVSASRAEEDRDSSSRYSNRAVSAEVQTFHKDENFANCPHFLFKHHRRRYQRATNRTRFCKIPPDQLGVSASYVILRNEQELYGSSLDSTSRQRGRGGYQCRATGSAASSGALACGRRHDYRSRVQHPVLDYRELGKLCTRLDPWGLVCGSGGCSRCAPRAAFPNRMENYTFCAERWARPCEVLFRARPVRQNGLRPYALI